MKTDFRNDLDRDITILCHVDGSRYIFVEQAQECSGHCT